MEIHPLLVAAVKAEYIRALEAKDLLEKQASATWVDPLVEAKVELVKASYEAHPEFLSPGSMSIKQLLLRMFESEDIVDGALKIIWADTRCFDSSGSDASLPEFKGLGCTNNADEDDATPLTIAIIGCGQMGWIQAVNAAIDPAFTVTWAVDVVEAAAEKLAAMPAFADSPPRVSTDYRAALADVGLECVLVLTPPSTHKEISVQALQAGKT